MDLPGPNLASANFIIENMNDLISPLEKYILQLMDLKHPIALTNMLLPERLIRIFKCPGRFCSFSSNVLGTASLHWRQHELIDAECVYCPYCDLFKSGDHSKLIFHIYQCHGECIYCCSKCFYRAVSKQAVESHLRRVHNTKAIAGVSVLRTIPHFLNMPMPISMPLLENKAVRPYVCKQRSSGRLCNYRTPFVDYFYNHTITVHHRSFLHPCYLCDVFAESINALILHMRAHQIKQYQCNRCLFGADTGIEMVDHFSGHHPQRKATAYIRSSSPRSLPLASLRNPEVPANNMVPAIIVDDNPLTEVERSIELESYYVPRIETTESNAPRNSRLVVVDDGGLDQETLLYLITPRPEPLHHALTIQRLAPRLPSPARNENNDDLIAALESDHEEEEESETEQGDN